MHYCKEPILATQFIQHPETCLIGVQCIQKEDKEKEEEILSHQFSLMYAGSYFINNFYNSQCRPYL